MGVVCSLGQTIDAFWRALIAGETRVDRITAFDPTAFDCQIAAEVRDFNAAPFFNMPKDARRSDRNIQFGVAGAKLAAQDSGRDATRSVVTVIGADGKSKKVVFESSRRFDAPNWSPDGSYLLAISIQVDGTVTGLTYTYTAQGGLVPT